MTKFLFLLIAAFVMYHVYTTTGSILYTILSGVVAFIGVAVFWLIIIVILVVLYTIIFDYD